MAAWRRGLLFGAAFTLGSPTFVVDRTNIATEEEDDDDGKELMVEEEEEEAGGLAFVPRVEFGCEL